MALVLSQALCEVCRVARAFVNLSSVLSLAAGRCANEDIPTAFATARWSMDGHGSGGSLDI